MLNTTQLFQQLQQLEQLKVLTLMRCDLASLPESLQLLSGLEVLQLGENQLSDDEQTRIKAWLPDTTVVF